jgi:hypothetical protein
LTLLEIPLVPHNAVPAYQIATVMDEKFGRAYRMDATDGFDDPVPHHTLNSL